jgi:uncharacterized membrane protein YedE/YeeE
MTVDWTAFTPWSALAGGVLIGAASALLLLLNGRIAGISGILGGLLTRAPGAGNRAWRAVFIGALVAAPLLYRALAALPGPRIDASWPVLAAAGLLVGIGTRLASGCTSGHGVCGLSQRSPRSLAATLAFMGAGFATVFVLRHSFIA